MRPCKERIRELQSRSTLVGGPGLLSFRIRRQMDEAEFQQKAQEIAELTASDEASGWWLSFADTDLEPGSQFLGASVVVAANLTDALTKSHEQGCNPGGQVKISGPIPPELVATIPPEYINVLMTRAQCEELDVIMGKE